MGTDVKLMLTDDGCGRTKQCVAHLGRKHALGCYGETFEKDADKLWPKINRIEEDARKELAILIGYTPKDHAELEHIVQVTEDKLTEVVENLVNLGRRIMLANILTDSAGILKLEDY